MALAEVVTLIGALAALTQVTLVVLNYWSFRQLNSSASPTTPALEANQLTQLTSGYTMRSQSKQKVFILGVLTLILYGILGFCFTVVHTSFWVWFLAISLNYWNLADLNQKGFGHGSTNYLVKILLSAHIMPFALVVAGIVWASIENLPIYLPIAVGLAIGIHSVVMTAVFTESFGKVKAVTLSTGLSGLGFVLSWMV